VTKRATTPRARSTKVSKSDDAPQPAAADTIAAPPSPSSSPARHAPSAGALDIQTIRRSWQPLLDRLVEQRQMILQANLQPATAASYDGATLELAFPPGKQFMAQRVQAKEDDLRKAFADVFGVSPRIVCTTRDEVPGSTPLVVDDEPGASSKAEALERLKSALGARVEGDEEGP
jgi:hypothetical protein